MLKGDLHFSSSSHKRQMHAIIMRNLQFLWSFIDSIKDNIFSKDMLRIEPNKLLEYYHSVFVLFLVFRKNRECNCLFSWENGKKQSGHKNNTHDQSPSERSNNALQCIVMRTKTDIVALKNALKLWTPFKIMGPSRPHR